MIDSFIFIFSNCIILVRVTVAPELILEKLGMRIEYTLDGMPVHCRAPHTHSFTSRDNLGGGEETHPILERTCTKTPEKNRDQKQTRQPGAVRQKCFHLHPCRELIYSSKY